MQRRRHVRILMGTLNGAAHLSMQLESLVRQSHAEWSLWVSDDGSIDGTQEMVTAFARAHPAREVRLWDGPRQGVGENYLSLLARSEPSEDALIALSDQDDVWHEDKLARAAAALDGVEGEERGGERDIPSAYAAAQIMWRPGGPERTSRPLEAGLSFRNALVQNVMSGNTLVFNAAALKVLNDTRPRSIPYHDWWIYQILSGVGARLQYDPVPALLYRQHRANHMGGNLGALAGVRRLARVVRRDYSGWLDANLAELTRAKAALTPENRTILANFVRARERVWPVRALQVMETGLYRQGRAGTLALWLAALGGRL